MADQPVSSLWVLVATAASYVTLGFRTTPDQQADPLGKDIVDEKSVSEWLKMCVGTERPLLAVSDHCMVGIRLGRDAKSVPAIGCPHP